jgi:hypothetical protein
MRASARKTAKSSRGGTCRPPAFKRCRLSSAMVRSPVSSTIRWLEHEGRFRVELCRSPEAERTAAYGAEASSDAQPRMIGPSPNPDHDLERPAASPDPGGPYRAVTRGRRITRAQFPSAPVLPAFLGLLRRFQTTTARWLLVRNATHNKAVET